MKIFLAGYDTNPVKAAISYFHPNTLFSYHYFKDANDRVKKLTVDTFNANGTEIICDSGLFTYMFGAGRGQNFSLSWWMDYAKRYIETVHSWGFKNITVVECDAHKLLGMDATWELRDVFKKSGLKVLYVWHKEETISGLISLCNTMDYIALSVPELRKVFKGHGNSYEQAVKDLLSRIHEKADRIPKIHLLGNTVEDLMKDHTPYSCDSTSWLAGIRYAQAKVFTNGTLQKVSLRSQVFRDIKESVKKEHCESLRVIAEHARGRTGKVPEYIVDALVCAKAYALYQKYLDRNYTWIGQKRKTA